MSEEIANSPRGSKLDKLKIIYRLIVVNDESLEEVGNYRLSPMNLYLAISTVLMGVIILVTSLIVFTPIKEFIPGYAAEDARATRREIVKLYQRIDNAEKMLETHRVYMEAMRTVMTGKGEGASSLAVPSDIQENMQEASNATTAPTPAAPTPTTTTRETSVKPSFVAPMQGLLNITDGFLAQPNHYGVDIAAPKDTPVQAVADGIVVSADWTLETGYVLAIQHSGNFISLYKHNAALLKTAGTTVKAGEAVAIIGNTGDLSSGPHLHFELWHQGQAVNPVNYIVF